MATQTSSLKIAFVGLSSLVIAMGIGRFVFTPLLPLMLNDGLVNISQGGWLASVHFLGYWLGAVFAAKLPFTPQSALRLSLIGIGLCTLGMGLMNQYEAWLALRFLAGIFSAFTLVLISNFYIRHLATIGAPAKQGWVFSGVGAGILITGFGTLAIMISGVDSSTSWQIFGVASLLSAILVSINIGPEISDIPPNNVQQRSKRTPLIWNIIIPYGALGVGYVIPATYLPLMARDIIPDPVLFGWAWPIFGFAAFLSTFFAVRLERRYSIREIWFASQVILAAGLLFPVIFPHITTIIISGICVGGTFMIITMMGMKETHRLAPSQDIMHHLAVMTAAFASGQIIGPVFASTIFALTQSFSASLVFASVLLIITAVALLKNSADQDTLQP
ncbi:MAG: YbfB/YjiJ family MFS transporter [Hyphomicrobiales bacterium]|nr:YbfB/YjiJ family MFS transporter [Hyphomicrobiales bacterium]